MAFAFIRKLLKRTGPKPITGGSIPKLPPAYVPPTVAQVKEIQARTDELTKLPGYSKHKVHTGSAFPTSAKYPQPTVHLPGTFRPEYHLPEYKPRKLEGLEDVILSGDDILDIPLPTFGKKKETKLGRGRSVIGGSAAPRPHPEAWEPKYPEFAVPDYDVHDLHDEGGAWIPAPTASHVESFRYLPAKVRPRTPWGAVIGGDSDDDIIDVRFKPTKYQGTCEYRYWFPAANHWLAQEIWELLIAAEHPGEIVHEYLIGLQITYKRMGEA